ncbi:MAG: hypothetical protein FWF59_00910 [Turicibacter sp.]|nr:hypothetical protein [Turicibacter sp.]
MRKRARITDAIKNPVFEEATDKASLTVYSRKGKAVTAFIDLADVGRVKDAGLWQAQWDTDHYAVLLRTEIDGHGIKMPLGAFILGVGHNAPVHHKNGDLLDFRQDNLGIFEKKDRNAYQLKSSHVVGLELLDRYGRHEATVLLDDADASRLQEAGHIWTVQKKGDGQPIVLCHAEEATLTLHRFLMGEKEGCFVHFINKNPLDCRQENMEFKLYQP